MRSVLHQQCRDLDGISFRTEPRVALHTYECLTVLPQAQADYELSTLFRRPLGYHGSWSDPVVVRWVEGGGSMFVGKQF